MLSMKIFYFRFLLIFAFFCHSDFVLSSTKNYFFLSSLPKKLQLILKRSTQIQIYLELQDSWF